MSEGSWRFDRRQLHFYIYMKRKMKSILRTVRENKVAYSLLTPLLLFFILLMWFPFFKSIWMSFHEWIYYEDVHAWVGLQNYVSLVTSKHFITSLVATGIYFIGTFVQLAIAIVAAVLLSQSFIRFKPFWFGLYVIPYAIPPVVSGTIWLYVLQPNLGVINVYLTKLIGHPWYWSSSTWGARGVVTAILGWTFWPFMFVILLASLQKIPRTHYEAASVFGASWWQTIYRVILPQARNSIIIVLIIRTVWNLIKVSQVLQLTQGGPGFDTSILPVLMYEQAHSSAYFGKGSATGMILLVLIFVLVLPLLRLIRKAFKEEAV